ncbi:MAG: vitamin B12 transporter [Paracoccaceae bacterium]|jgi:vitamin B12 transporter
MFLVQLYPLSTSIRFRRLAGFYAVLFSCSWVSAAAVDAESRLESILVTAHAPQRDRFQLLEVLDVIEGPQIRVQQAASLNAVLSGVRGLYASREGGPGGINTLSLRGAEPNFTAVLIDGVAVNDPTNSRGGSFDLATLSAASLGRIAIVKGPQSLAYGADALAGVVLLDTFAPGKGETTLITSYEQSEGGAHRAHMLANLSAGNQSLGLQAGRENSANTYRGSSLKLDERSLQYRANWGEQLQFQLGARDADFAKRAYPEQSGGVGFAANDDQDISAGRDQTRYFALRLALFDNWSVAAQYNDYVRELDYRSPGVAPYNNVPANRYLAEYSRHQWRVISELYWGPLNLNVGVDRRWERGDSSGEVVFTNVSADALGFLLGLPSLPVESGMSLPLEFILPTDYRMRRTTEGGVYPTELAV